MIDESKCNWPIEPIDVALTRLNGTILTTAVLNSTYNQIPLNNESMRDTHFTIGNEQYCFKRLFFGISIGPAAFASILTHFLYPLIRKGTVITYVDDIFIQTTTYEQMCETLEENQNLLQKKTKLDWELFCKEFSDMFDSEKSKQQAKIVLQQIQKHTNESLRSLALRIETLVKTAYTLYTEDYKNSVMSQTFIQCLDNE